MVLHDHVIGFHLFAPLLDTRRVSLSPTLGTCVDFAFSSARNDDAVGTQTVRFGVHTGALLEVHLPDGVSVFAQGTLYAYLGNDTTSEGWTASVSNRLGVHPVGVATLGANVAF